jgi:hypothetical protein
VLGRVPEEMGVGEVAVLGGAGRRGLRRQSIDDGGEDAVEVQGQSGVVGVVASDVVAEDLRASPMPELAPVTTTVRPAKRWSMGWPSFRQ